MSRDDAKKEEPVVAAAAPVVKQPQTASLLDMSFDAPQAATQAQAPTQATFNPWGSPAQAAPVVAAPPSAQPQWESFTGLLY